MNKSEKAALLALSEAGCTIYRNEVAGAWAGKVIHKAGDQVTIRPARHITTGLAVGSSDLIGVTPVVITPEMVGQTVGVFTAVEVKAGRDRLSTEQGKFLELMRSLGAIAGEARSSGEARGIVERYTNNKEQPCPNSPNTSTRSRMHYSASRPNE